MVYYFRIVSWNCLEIEIELGRAIFMMNVVWMVLDIEVFDIQIKYFVNELKLLDKCKYRCAAGCV